MGTENTKEQANQERAQSNQAEGGKKDTQPQQNQQQPGKGNSHQQTQGQGDPSRGPVDSGSGNADGFPQQAGFVD